MHSLFIAEGITDHDLDTFVDMYREHCEVGILLHCYEFFPEPISLVILTLAKLNVLCKI